MTGWRLPFGGTTWSVDPGSCWVVTGPAASGKTTLAVRLHALFSDRVALVTFGAQAASAGTSWAEARYYASIEYDFRTVEDALSYESVNDINPFEVRPPEKKARAAFKRLRRELEKALDLTGLLDRWTVQLSNGEQRRLLLARAILKQCDMLVLDDPFAGLDADHQLRLHALIETLSRSGRTLVVMVRNEDEIPACTTHRLRLKACTILSQGPWRKPADDPDPEKLSFTDPPPLKTPTVLSIRNLTLSMGGKSLFSDFNWEVHAGERWVIMGPNGSGKTTLFALITGDSPLAYACDIERFGKRLGPGIPLWSVRSRLAVLSPELQAFSDPTLTIESVLYSGLFAEDGSRLPPTPAHRKRAAELLKTLKLSASLKDPIGSLSDGTARLIFVIRALLASPELLLLDEPCMNLEAAERTRFLRLMEKILDKTPGLTVLLIAHRRDHVPAGFDRLLKLGAC